MLCLCCQLNIAPCRRYIKSFLLQVRFPSLGWRLPDSEDELTEDERTCLSSGRIFSPESGTCVSLLSRGPCEAGEWLVLSGDRVVCRERVCPCSRDRPDLCEVEMESGDCRCRVALAAAQDGLCEDGEQLVVSPAGYGVCGCLQSPPHLLWPHPPHQRCHPLHHRGPCQQHFVLTADPDTTEPVCSPAVCGEARVLWQVSLSVRVVRFIQTVLALFWFLNNTRTKFLENN